MQTDRSFMTTSGASNSQNLSPIRTHHPSRQSTMISCVIIQSEPQVDWWGAETFQIFLDLWPQMPGLTAGYDDQSAPWLNISNMSMTLMNFPHVHRNHSKCGAELETQAILCWYKTSRTTHTFSEITFRVWRNVRADERLNSTPNLELDLSFLAHTPVFLWAATFQMVWRPHHHCAAWNAPVCLIRPVSEVDLQFSQRRSSHTWSPRAWQTRFSLVRIPMPKQALAQKVLTSQSISDRVTDNKFDRTVSCFCVQTVFWYGNLNRRFVCRFWDQTFSTSKQVPEFDLPRNTRMQDTISCNPDQWPFDIGGWRLQTNDSNLLWLFDCSSCLKWVHTPRALLVTVLGDEHNCTLVVFISDFKMTSFPRGR